MEINEIFQNINDQLPWKQSGNIKKIKSICQLIFDWVLFRPIQWNIRDKTI